jgi:hypothetical protein
MNIVTIARAPRRARFPYRLRTVLARAATSLLALAAACGDETPTRLVAPRASASTTASADSIDVDRAPSGAAKAKWTVMVYLAADNNLALAGVADVDEMEAAVARAAASTGAAAGDVKVVVEGEFSPSHLARAGCGGPQCVGLQNWNTFRYVVAGRAPNAQGTGPAGRVIDLGGNRDMTRPEELRDFVQWAKREHPADHYMLVLWNHGGGYTGLIADEGSAGSRLMTIDGMRAALADAGRVDVVNFDMCLMAGYETLAKLHGLVDYAVFSEAVVPGAGHEYRLMLGAIFQRPEASAAQVAAVTADAFHISYDGSRSSTTISAYALAKFPTFEEKLGQLARALREDAARTTPLVREAARKSQKYEQPGLHDLGHFIALLSSGVDERSELYKAMEATFMAAVDSGFRLRSYARNGSGSQAADMSKSTGLHILVPSGEGTDVIAATGPGSFDAYRAQLPDKEWTRFLADYLHGEKATAMVDQGDERFEAYLVWEEDAPAKGADVDFWLIEPDGSIYIPWLGRVTPNGQLSNDSAEEGTFYEGWASFQVVAKGSYYVIANLYADPNDFRPLFNLAYRFGTESDFEAYFDEPRLLSTRRSWLADSTPSLDEVFEGAYTDLQPVARWTPTPAEEAPSAVALDGARGARGALRPVAGAALRAGGEPRPRLTAAQLTTVRRAVAERRVARALLRADAGPRPRAAPPGGLERLAPR